VAKAWTRELAKEGIRVDWQRLMPPDAAKRLSSTSAQMGGGEDLLLDLSQRVSQ
jgi:hypothetical protein